MPPLQFSAVRVSELFFRLNRSGEAGMKVRDNQTGEMLHIRSGYKLALKPPLVILSDKPEHYTNPDDSPRYLLDEPWQYQSRYEYPPDKYPHQPGEPLTEPPLIIDRLDLIG